MKNWTIGSRIIVGFSTLIVLTMLLGGSALWRLNSTKDALHNLAKNSMPSLVLMAEIIDDGQEQMLAQLDTINSEDPAAIAKADALVDEKDKSIQAHLASYKELISDAEDRQLYEKIVSAYAAVTELRPKLKELHRQGNADEYKKLFLQTQITNYEHFSEAASKDFAYNVKQGEKAGQDGETQANAGLFSTKIIIGVVLVIALLIAIAMIRSINSALRAISTNLEEGSLRTASAAKQVLSASQSLSTGATEQAAAIEETSASLEEMSTMIRTTADSAQQAKALAAEARGVAENGTKTMTEMNQAMTAIDSSSAEVAKIVKNIDEIAFQTNILALNAAVEAARAGEAGAGFAVVADEVRSLAQRSAAAAKETADKIEAAISNSRRGTECTALVGKALLQISEKVSATDALVGNIARAASEQSQGISQIGTAINQMETVSQTNSASAEQSASSAQELEAQAENLKNQVLKLGALVGASTDHTEERDHEIRLVQTPQVKRPASAAPSSAVKSPAAPALGGGRRRALGNIPMPEPADDGSDDSGFRRF